ISAHGQDRLDLKDYTSGHYTGDDFKKGIPELEEIADLTFTSIARISRTQINSKHWIQLRKKVMRALHEDTYDGVVITHGTNTLEETAYFLHFTINSEKPVVLVGAQRPYTALSSDAQLNLLSAI